MNKIEEAYLQHHFQEKFPSEITKSKGVLFVAQKGVILNEDRTKILVIKYKSAEFNSDKIAGKYAFPGGKVHFGETPEQSFIREVKEETGVTVTPLQTFYHWSFVYKKHNEFVQIFVVGRVGIYQSGKIIETAIGETETVIESIQWVKIEDLYPQDFVYDEKPMLETFLQLQKEKLL